MTKHLQESYQHIKSKFLRALDYIEDTHEDAELVETEDTRSKCSINSPIYSVLTNKERNYLRVVMLRLAQWEPLKNMTKGPATGARKRVKRIIGLLAGIGSIVNAIQIKKIKKNIKILQAQNILQDQKIDELARFMNVTAARVHTHDNQI